MTTSRRRALLKASLFPHIILELKSRTHDVCHSLKPPVLRDVVFLLGPGASTGNTTAAIGKGSAIGSVALVSLALLEVSAFEPTSLVWTSATCGSSQVCCSLP